MKKISAILLALVMMLSMVAMAAETAEKATVTLGSSNTTNDENTTEESYYAYKILTADTSGKVYTIAADDKVWLPVLQDADQTWLTLTKSADETVYVVTLKDGVANSDDTAKALAQYLYDNKPATATAVELKVGTNELDHGYYLVSSTMGTALVLNTYQNATIAVKNSYPTVTKSADKANASINDVITYTITVHVPETVSEDIDVTDTMEAGLTFIGNTTDTAIQGSHDTTTRVTTWTIPTSYAGQDVVLKYEAYINTASGEISTETNDNEVYIEYSKFKSEPDTASVVTYKATFLKVGDEDVALKDVTFKLTDEKGTEIVVIKTEAGAYRVKDRVSTADAATITTGEDGTFTIEGLGNGNYKLVELSTNAGYNLLTEPVEFEIKDGNNEYVNAEGENNDNNVIVNKSGSTLPSTGGMGTTLFYVVGGLMMAAAVVLLVSKKKVNA